MNCLIGHFGDDDDDLNEALLQASAEFESKITPCATTPSLVLALSILGAGLHLEQAPPTVTHFLLLL